MNGKHHRRQELWVVGVEYHVEYEWFAPTGLLTELVAQAHALLLAPSSVRPMVQQLSVSGGVRRRNNSRQGSLVGTICCMVSVTLIPSSIVLGRQSRNDLADLRHEPHPHHDDDHDVSMILGAPVDDDADDTWEDVMESEEEPLVYAIRDILGAR